MILRLEKAELKYSPLESNTAGRQGCFDDVSQSTPLVTGEPPQFLLNLIAYLNDHAIIIRCRTNLGNRGGRRTRHPTSSQATA